MINQFYDNRLKQYIILKQFEEEVILHPKFLNKNLMENLKLHIKNKYPKIYRNEGFIFNITRVKILKNIITPLGQCKFKILFEANFYTPEIGHIFNHVQLKKSPVGKKYWVEINPLIIFLKNCEENDLIQVKITDVKNDKSGCFGSIINE